MRRSPVLSAARLGQASAAGVSALRRRIARACAGLATLALCVPAAAVAAQAEPTELAVKAAYLYKLAPFAGWPPSAFKSPTAPFVICIQGADPFGAVLDRAVATQRVGGRAIAVARLSRVAPGSGCHVAYIAGSPVQPRPEALEALRGAHVLTVTDEAIGAAPHGMIHFVLRDGRVRFEIDLRQAEGAGVTISSKLLAVAVTVVR